MPETALARRDVTLLDLVDTILQKGAVLSGDLVLAVADVDLVQVNLPALLASVETIRRLGSDRAAPVERSADPGGDRAEPTPGAPEAEAADPVIAPDGRRGTTRSAALTVHPRRPPPVHGRSSGGSTRSLGRINTEPENVERGLAQLVLTIIELLRQLMERQALTRMDAGSLSEDEVERLGDTFMKLEQRMERLKRDFGLEDEELNLHLGPLGDLM